MPTPTETLTGTVLMSGALGSFDDNNGDFDILREAVVAAGLGGALNDPEANLIVFAQPMQLSLGLLRYLATPDRMKPARWGISSKR